MELCGILTGTHEEGGRAPRDPDWWGSSVNLALCFTALGPTLLLQIATRGKNEICFTIKDMAQKLHTLQILKRH